MNIFIFENHSSKFLIIFVQKFKLEAPLVFPWLILKFSHTYSGTLPWYILKTWLILCWQCENFNINQGNTRGASNLNFITPNTNLCSTNSFSYNTIRDRNSLPISIKNVNNKKAYMNNHNNIELKLLSVFLDLGSRHFAFLYKHLSLPFTLLTIFETIFSKFKYLSICTPKYLTTSVGAPG
jgi:hypothetical protein